MRVRGALALTFLGFLAFAQSGRDLRIESTEPANPLHDRGTRWAVVVGISSYAYLPPKAQLLFAHRDAEEYAAFLKSLGGGAIPATHIRLLENEEASLAGIRAALDTWLVESARPEDIVYVFFAGHGVLDDHGDGYFVAHDSDPQNLHATALPFAEVEHILSERLRAGLVVLVADACHTGRLGWSSYAPGLANPAAETLARIGQGDRSLLKLLATRPSEQSLEDSRFDGGHGAFTEALLEGLRGEADRDGDHVVRAVEAIDYLSRRVPELTGALQHPRVAGTFDGQVALALSPNSRPPGGTGLTLDVFGPVGSSLYLDNIFRGRIRPTGTLRIDALSPGPHAISADFAGGITLEGSVTLGDRPARVTIAPPPAGPVAELRVRIAGHRILEAGGAWDYYRGHNFSAAERGPAAALMGEALEGLGQACVSDYVQSTALGPKRVMLQQAVDAYDRLRALRPADGNIEVRQLFCRGRLLIAENRFGEAVVTLQASLQRDPRFACAQNALGVALANIGRPREARQAFEAAAKLTPEWGLPPYEIAVRLAAAGDLGNARGYLQKAVSFNPNSLNARWNLAHVERLLGHRAEAERQAEDLLRIAPGYAPAYIELGLAYEADGQAAKAVDAYEAYAALAPNYSDTNTVRARIKILRGK